jgi:hypothetical protein
MDDDTRLKGIKEAIESIETGCSDVRDTIDVITDDKTAYGISSPFLNTLVNDLVGIQRTLGKLLIDIREERRKISLYSGDKRRM